MTDKGKAELVHKVGLAVRRMSAQGVLSSAAMAKHFDLHPTDLEVLDLIFLRESVSAGDLVKATGLTSGSVTALLDRLEVKAFIVRERDDADRRRAVVRLNRTATAPIEAAYEPRQKAMFELWSQFDVQMLETIADFLERSTDLLVTYTEEIASLSRPGEESAQPQPAPAVRRQGKEWRKPAFR